MSASAPLRPGGARAGAGNCAGLACRPQHHSEDMAKVTNNRQMRPRRDASVPSPYQEARDELFQHIMQCGVIGCHPEDQKEWFDATLQYLTDRYPELRATELAELRTLGERFAQPAKKAEVAAAS